MNQCLETLSSQQDELQIDISTLNVLTSQLEGWKKELYADLVLVQQEMTHPLRQQGDRCTILLGRLPWYQLWYYSLIDTARIQQEWKETKSLQSNKSLEIELLDHIHEAA